MASIVFRGWIGIERVRHPLKDVVALTVRPRNAGCLDLCWALQLRLVSTPAAVSLLSLVLGAINLRICKGKTPRCHSSRDLRSQVKPLCIDRCNFRAARQSKLMVKKTSLIGVKKTQLVIAYVGRAGQGCQYYVTRYSSFRICVLL